MAQGATQVDDGVQKLTGGVSQLSHGLKTLAQRLPGDAQLAQLKEGSQTLASGSHALSGGLEQLSAGSARLDQGIQALHAGSTQLNDGLARLEAALPAGGAEGMGKPVVTREQVTAEVPTNGLSFAPYFMGLSLYVGALMTSFIFSYVRVPESTLGASQGARMLSKVLMPAGLVIAQAIAVGLTMQLVLRISVPNPLSFYAILAAGSLTFLCIIQALCFILRDAGKGIAVLFLLVQLGAAGGPFPIELSGAFFQAVHAYLPFTYLLKALRASLFGSYLGAWEGFVGWMALGALVALSFSYVLGRRWKPVPDQAYGPAIDL